MLPLKTATLNPSGTLLANTTYTVTLTSAIKDTAGNKLTATFINHVVRHSLENSTEAAFGAYLQAWAKSDFSDKVQPDTSTPVKLVVGVNDPAMSADVMEQTWLVYFPEAEMTIMPDAGHYPMFESPVSLATSIEEFLGRD